MALGPCKECGELISSKAPTCPNCGAVINKKYFKKEKKQFKIGCGGLIILLIIFGYTFSKCSEYTEERSIRLEQESKLIEKRKKQENFIENIDKHYNKMVSNYNKSPEKAVSQLKSFRKYGKINYRDVNEYNKRVISHLENIVKPIPAWNTKENLRGYKNLLALDPSNDKYKKKVNYYSAKLKQKQRKSQQTKTTTASTTSSFEKYTVGGYAAAPSEYMLDKAINLSVKNDTVALQSLINSGSVIILKGGIKVDIVDTKLFSGKIKIRPYGSNLELWTVIEAVE